MRRAGGFFLLGLTLGVLRLHAFALGCCLFGIFFHGFALGCFVFPLLLFNRLCFGRFFLRFLCQNGAQSFYQIVPFSGIGLELSEQFVVPLQIRVACKPLPVSGTNSKGFSFFLTKDLVVRFVGTSVHQAYFGTRIYVAEGTHASLHKCCKVRALPY